MPAVEHEPPTTQASNPPSGTAAPSLSPCCASAQKKEQRRSVSAGLRAALSGPGAVLPLVPSANCPLCLAAYTGILSTLGLGFLFTERVLSHLVVVFLVVGVGSIAWTLRAHGRRSPLLLAVLASALIVSGRLIWSMPLAVYLGAALFLTAAAWNFWLRVQLTRKAQPA